MLFSASSLSLSAAAAAERVVRAQRGVRWACVILRSARGCSLQVLALLSDALLHIGRARTEAQPARAVLQPVLLFAGISGTQHGGALWLSPKRIIPNKVSSPNS